jgi:hypothetical protein
MIAIKNKADAIVVPIADQKPIQDQVTIVDFF